ncbi:vomeronasal type-2 receptor 26-like [Hemicordylus capensis]|uniref:vomeronasal type-2 receptor 26-like n=1 Tax=Hemicordylus capensis TaxID=884348 RepID=UPI002302A152|nr:vomeronasal type-2 receptor 26-like [Hemicordylus capensis]
MGLASTDFFKAHFIELRVIENYTNSSIPKNYQQVLSLTFALKEINENPKILPNVSLGFQIYDSYANARMTYQNTLTLLSSRGRIVPNFKCDKEKNLMAVIGGHSSEISLHIATVFGMYKFPQIAYCVFTPVVNVKLQLPSFYRMVPNEVYQYKGIVQLLLHFHWTWIGIIISDDDNNGEMFVETLMPMLSQNGICTAVTEKMPAIFQALGILSSLKPLTGKAYSLSSSRVQVFIVNARPQTMICLIWLIYLSALFEGIGGMKISIGKVWIMTAHWDFSFQTMHRAFDIQLFDGALSFAIHSNEVLGFPKFLQSLHHKLQEGDDFLRTFWENAFSCSFSDSNEDKESTDTCTGQERLGSLSGTLFEMSMTGQSYSIYNAIHAIAQTLHEVYTSKAKLRALVDRQRVNQPNIQPWQLHPFLRSISFNNSAGDTVSFDRNGELAAGFDILNWITFPNQSFSRIKVGRMDPENLRSQEVFINKVIRWHSWFNQEYYNKRSTALITICTIAL